MKGVSVCAVELPSLSPILLVQSRQYPAVERYPETATGNSDFDGGSSSRSADDLLARVEQLSSPEEVVTFLGQLSPEDRQRLAQSDSPLAAFADVTTWDQVMARLQSLDVAQRMQLLARLKRAKSGSGD